MVCLSGVNGCAGGGRSETKTIFKNTIDTAAAITTRAAAPLEMEERFGCRRSSRPDRQQPSRAAACVLSHNSNQGRHKRRGLLHQTPAAHYLLGRPRLRPSIPVLHDSPSSYLVSLVGSLHLLLVRRHKPVSRLRTVLGLRVVHLEQQAALVAREVSRLRDLVPWTANLDDVPRLHRDGSAGCWSIGFVSARVCGWRRGVLHVKQSWPCKKPWLGRQASKAQIINYEKLRGLVGVYMQDGRGCQLHVTVPPPTNLYI